MLLYVRLVTSFILAKQGLYKEQETECKKSKLKTLSTVKLNTASTLMYADAGDS